MLLTGTAKCDASTECSDGASLDNRSPGTSFPILTRNSNSRFGFPKCLSFHYNEYMVGYTDFFVC